MTKKKNDVKQPILNWWRCVRTFKSLAWTFRFINW